MATLIAANYQSQSSTAYGFMSTWNIKLKNNTLYTLKCRYKWNKNGTSSTCPLAGYLYETTWSNHCGAAGSFNGTHTTYKTMIRTFTTNGNAASYSFSISNYANGQKSSGVADGAILDVDWYELWEGDATTFSLTDAIALSENKTATNFVSIGGHPTDVGTCTNTGYFSTAEPRHALRSWIGYYYKTQSTTSYGDWVYTYNHYTSASRSRTVTTYDHYSNGKVVQTGSTTQTEAATVTYAPNWSYNWVTTGNSTRSRTVTYSWSDYSSTATQTETGGTRYLVLSEEIYDGAGGKIVYSFPANGAGSKSLTVYAHDYWGSTCISSSTKISDVSVTCTGFTPTVSGSTITITASNLGTTPTNYKRSTITISKSGFQTRSGYTSVEQEANAVTSIKAVASNASTNSLHFSYPNGTTLTAAGITVSPTLTGAAIFYFTSGADSGKISSSGAHYGGTLSFARSYIESTDVSWASVNSSSGAVTVNANTGAQRTVNIRSTLTVNWGSLSNSLVQSYDCKQNADSISSTTYGNVTKGTITNATIPASGTTTNYTATAGNGSQVLTYSWVSGKANTTETKTIAPSVASISATASSKGQTKSDITTVKSQAVTWSGSGGKSASGTMYIYQAANTCTETTKTEWSVDSVSPTSKSVAATSGSFTLSWRQVKRTRTEYSNWSSGSPTSYSWSSWVAETNSKPTNVTSDSSWMTVGTFGTSGSDGKNSVTITYTANSGTSTRSGNITISNGAGSGKCAVSQAVDAVDAVKSVVIKSVTVTGGAISSQSFAAAGATKTVGNSTSPSCTVTLTLTYKSGRTEDTTSYSSYGTLTGPTYSWKVNGSNATGSSSTLSVTMPNNTTTSSKSWPVVRTASYTFKLNSTYGGASKSNSNTASATCTQTAGSKSYSNPTVTAYTYSEFAAAGATLTPTVTWSQVWTWNGVSGSGGTLTGSNTDSNNTDTYAFSMTSSTNGFKLSNTTTGAMTVTNNTTASSRKPTYKPKVKVTVNGKTNTTAYSCKSCTQKAGTKKTTSTYRISKVYADYTDVDKYGGNPYVYVNIEKKTDISWNGIVTSTGSWTTLTGKQANTDFGSTAPFNLYVNQTGSYSNSAFVTLGNISLTNSTATTAAIYRSQCSIPSNYDAYARTNTISAVLSSNTTNSGYTGEGKNYITFTQAANITYTMDIFAKGSNKNSVTVYADIAGDLTFNYPTRESQTDISLYATLYGNSSVGDMFDGYHGYYASVYRDDNLAPYSVTCNLYGNITNSSGDSMSYRGCKLRLVFKSGSTTVYTTDWQNISTNYNPLEWNTTSYEFYIGDYEFPSDVTMWMEFEFGNF